MICGDGGSSVSTCVTFGGSSLNRTFFECFLVLVSDVRASGSISSRLWRPVKVSACEEGLGLEPASVQGEFTPRPS